MTDENVIDPKAALEKARLEALTNPFTPPKNVPVPLRAPKRFYAASTRGFYSDDIHGTMPGDALEITTDQWSALLQAQSQGKQIAPGPDGKPIAIDPIVTPAMKRQRIEAQIDVIRKGPEMADALRETLLGKPGAKERLAAIDAQIGALRATIPPMPPEEMAAAPGTPQ